MKKSNVKGNLKKVIMHFFLANYFETKREKTFSIDDIAYYVNVALEYGKSNYTNNQLKGYLNNNWDEFKKVNNLYKLKNIKKMYKLYY